MKGWLVNDCLTCIPGTITFWHNLLDWFPSLENKTKGYTPFNMLASSIEIDLQTANPKYIIRNCTFFRKINTDVPTIAILQDSYMVGSPVFQEQLDVVNNSRVVVFNSPYTYEKYRPYIGNNEYKIIPLGTDSELFRPQIIEKPTDIIFVGSSAHHPKGFDIVQTLIDKTDYTFILVMKDNFKLDHPRVTVFNEISQENLVNLLNQARVLICTSREETLHLAGIEAGFCNVPIVTSDVGIYSSIKNDQRWGRVVEHYTIDAYKENIKHVLNNVKDYSPRESFLDNKLDLKSCKGEWEKCITQIL